MRILVVDDEQEMASLVARGLAAEDHEVRTAADGVSALTLLREDPVDVAVLDVMMPGMDGFELCRWIKRDDPRTVVILLTARDAVDDRVRGLDEGADDYLVKPFSMAELAARIRAIQRRDALAPASRTVRGEVELDLLRGAAVLRGRPLALSRTEFDLLRVLLGEEEVVPRTRLLEEVWGTATGIDPNVLDQYVSYLRRKLASHGAGARISTVRGVGYRWEEQA